MSLFFALPFYSAFFVSFALPLSLCLSIYPLEVRLELRGVLKNVRYISRADAVVKAFATSHHHCQYGRPFRSTILPRNIASSIALLMQQVRPTDPQQTQTHIKHLARLCAYPRVVHAKRVP